MRRALLIISMILIVSVLNSACADKAKPQPIAFPNVPIIDIPEDIGYDGFFDKKSQVKIVFGVSDPGPQLRESLINAAYTVNYLKPREIPYSIHIVLYARAVKAASVFSEDYGGYTPLIESLHKAGGVEFSICYNSMHSLKVDREDVFPFMKVIPAGILQIAKKQMEGYAYINNASLK